MKDIKETQRETSEEMRRFEITGHTNKHILQVELNGVSAILFRTMVNLSKDEQKIENIQGAIKIGVIMMTKQLLAEAGLKYE